MAVPGISHADYDKYVTHESLNIIAGTSDVIFDEECKKLMQLAPQYAASYNQEMLWPIEICSP